MLTREVFRVCNPVQLVQVASEESGVGDFPVCSPELSHTLIEAGLASTALYQDCTNACVLRGRKGAEGHIHLRQVLCPPD